MPLNKFFQRVDDLIDEIHNSPSVNESEHILVPGEMEWERREKALSKGIKMPSDVVSKMRDLDKRIGLNTHWLA